MPRSSMLFALTAALAASVALPAHADMVFNRIATFPVADNLPADADKTKPTSSEIITASEDGNTLVYSDSPLRRRRLHRHHRSRRRPRPAASSRSTASRPRSPSPAARCSPASTRPRARPSRPAISPSSISPPRRSKRPAISAASRIRSPQQGRQLPGHRHRERARRGGRTTARSRRLPAGNLKIVPLNAGVPDCAAIKTVDLTGIATVAPEDPEPEFVAFNEAGEIAVTLQENNHIAIVDAATGKIVAHFSAGASRSKDRHQEGRRILLRPARWRTSRASPTP